MQPKILLVDDREDNLLSMESLLEPDGYRVVKASSGKQVLKILLSDLDFALILMDVQMPNLNGFETASLIYEREKLRHIPIIFITAHNYGEDHVFKAYRAGAVDYIYKPVRTDLLKAKVAVFVDIYKKNQRLLAQEQKLVAVNKSLELEIHERKASEATVKELNGQLLDNISRLESANKDLDLFAFMASHDLQAPLRKIRMFSDMLLLNHKEGLNQDGQLYLQRIQEVARKMQDLINDILKFSRISVGKDSFEQSDLDKILGDVLQEMDPAIKEKQAEIIRERLPMIPVSGMLMGTLFANLIGNALKYSSKERAPVIRIYSEGAPLIFEDDKPLVPDELITEPAEAGDAGNAGQPVASQEPLAAEGTALSADNLPAGKVTSGNVNTGVVLTGDITAGEAGEGTAGEGTAGEYGNGTESVATFNPAAPANETPPMVSAENREQALRFVRIFVEDNGIGFDQKYAGQIFDMFRRLHPSAEYEGTGIGLALCKRIVEKHKGYISARGRPGEGSTFVITLPLKQLKQDLQS